MNAEELRNELIGIFGQQIRFNRDFDNYAEHLKDEMKSELVKWCRKCKEDLYRGHTPQNPDFKDLYVFFRKIGNSIRTILIKIKNKDFIEIHLADHRYYDDKRKELGFKKDSYYGI